MRDFDSIIGEALRVAEKQSRPVFVFSTKRGLARDFMRPTVLPYHECTAWGETIARPAGYVPSAQSERELMYHVRETPAASVAPVPKGSTRSYDARLRGRVLFGPQQGARVAPVKLFTREERPAGTFGTRALAIAAPAVQGPPSRPFTAKQWREARNVPSVAPVSLDFAF